MIYFYNTLHIVSKLLSITHKTKEKPKLTKNLSLSLLFFRRNYLSLILISSSCLYRKGQNIQ
jgi:hypothetical protein